MYRIKITTLKNGVKLYTPQVNEKFLFFNRWYNLHNSVGTLIEGSNLIEMQYATEEGAKHIITLHQAKVSRGVKSFEYKNID